MNERGEASNKETSSSKSTEQPAMLDAAKTFHSYDPSSKRPCVRPRRAQSQTRTPARRLPTASTPPRQCGPHQSPHRQGERSPHRSGAGGSSPAPS
jgi:hypothetical protein